MLAEVFIEKVVHLMQKDYGLCEHKEAFLN